MKETRVSYLATRILDAPIWAIYNMLPIILYKDLHASPFELALLVSIKPLMSVGSFYFSHVMSDKKLTSTIMSARVIGLMLFLVFPFVTSIPLILVAYGLYMAMAVGTVPAWTELLRQNLGESEQKKTFALGSSFGYLGGALLPFVFAYVMDNSQGSWKWLFLVASMIALLGTLLISKLPSKNAGVAPKKNITEPWKESLGMIKAHPDFMQFQAAFMIFGAGLMILQPALPGFFVDELHMSYVELALALSFCKGVSYALAAPFFASFLQRLGIFKFGLAFASLAMLFPVLLMLAKWQTACVYLAYIVYGTMQSGSELAWNMSGPIFSKNKESLSFTRMNIITVGLRGAVAPAFGAFLLSYIGSFWVQSVGLLFFLAAALIFNMRARNFIVDLKIS